MMQFTYDIDRQNLCFKLEGPDAKVIRDRLSKMFDTLRNKRYPYEWQDKIEFTNGLNKGTKKFTLSKNSYEYNDIVTKFNS